MTPKAWRTRRARRELTMSSRHPGQRLGRRNAAGSWALGLAAGFDLDGRLIDAMNAWPFGGIEFGSVRLHDRAFGRLQRVLRRAGRRREGRGTLERGVSVVKHRATPWCRAVGELGCALRALSGLADYVTLNPGSPHPPAQEFFTLVGNIRILRDTLHVEGRVRTPLFAKIPSSWSHSEEALSLACDALGQGLDGLLLSGEGIPTQQHLSLLRDLRTRSPVGVRLFSVGGVRTPRDALQRIQAGADRVQIHAIMRNRGRLRWVMRAVSLLAGSSRGWAPPIRQRGCAVAALHPARP